MHEVDLSACDMVGSVLDDCDMAGATFDNTNIEKADLRTAINYTIDPNANRIKNAKFSLPEAVGLLYKFDIEVSG